MSVGDVDGRFLATFLAVAEEGTFAAAADAVGVTQPAVSYRMAQLEEQIGVALFERAGRGTTLTPAGRALHDFCSRYLGELGELTARLTGRPGPRPDPVRVSAIRSFGRWVLFPVLCSEAFRGRSVELLYHGRDEILRRVERGDADLGVVDRAPLSPGLEAREIGREELVMIAAAEARAPEPVERGDLESRPFVTWSGGGPALALWFDHHFGGQPARVRSAHHFGELQEVVAMAALGRGLAVVPLACVTETLDTGRVGLVEPGPEPCLRAIHAVTRADTPPREGVVEILEAVTARGTRRS